MFWKLSAVARAAVPAGPTYRPETPLLVKNPAGVSGSSHSPKCQDRRREQARKAGPHPQLELALE